jgi:hypothetical protein
LPSWLVVIPNPGAFAGVRNLSVGRIQAPRESREHT